MRDHNAISNYSIAMEALKEDFQKKDISWTRKYNWE